jgi:hypothetical protein
MYQPDEYYPASTVAFIKSIASQRVDGDYFVAFNNSVTRGKKGRFNVILPALDFSPAHFFDCWHDPELTKIDKATLLEWCAESVSEMMPTKQRLKVK